jgi:hypothetical protein
MACSLVLSAIGASTTGEIMGGFLFGIKQISVIIQEGFLAIFTFIATVILTER